jgi:hypothetical protein
LQVPVLSVVTTPVEDTEHTAGVVEAYVIGWPDVEDAAMAIVPPLLYVAGAGDVVGEVTVIVSGSRLTMTFVVGAVEGDA